MKQCTDTHVKLGEHSEAIFNLKSNDGRIFDKLDLMQNKVERMKYWQMGAILSPFVATGFLSNGKAQELLAALISLFS